jgi:hypothetical protein
VIQEEIRTSLLAASSSCSSSAAAASAAEQIAELKQTVIDLRKDMLHQKPFVDRRQQELEQEDSTTWTDRDIEDKIVVSDEEVEELKGPSGRRDLVLNPLGARHVQKARCAASPKTLYVMPMYADAC